ncbi:MAG: dipicolinate synthase subunit B [Angelakisella sp.]
MSSQKSIGYGFCGSFCTLAQSVEQLRALGNQGYALHPIMSEITYSTDTRFGLCADFINEIECICGRSILHTIPQVEPIGPKGYLDALIIAPCTGNTIGKLANGIYDTSITMAVKAQLRNHKPVILAIATNDGLSGSAKNIGRLLTMHNLYIVPMQQDDPLHKPDSLISDFSKIEATLLAALEGRQLRPIYV